jgi:CRP-like cAMP-binding protein
MIPISSGNNRNKRVDSVQREDSPQVRIQRAASSCPGLGNCGICSFQSWSGALGLSLPVQQRMAPLWRENVYHRGDVIFYQGNNPTSIYFLCHGSVKLVRDARMGRQHILRMITGPDFLGDRAMLAGQPYAASAQVMEDSRVCAIDGQSFRALWRDEPELSRMLAIYLARKLAEADVAASDLALLTIRELLARLIVGRIPPGGGDVVRFSESRQDLADILGTSAEVISRTLSELARKKLIALDGRSLRVLDEERLRLIGGAPARRGEGNTAPEAIHFGGKKADPSARNGSLAIKTKAKRGGAA